MNKTLLETLCVITLLASSALAAEDPARTELEVNRSDLSGYRLVSLTLAAEDAPQVSWREVEMRAPKRFFLGHLDSKVIQLWSTAQAVGEPVSMPSNHMLTTADYEHLHPRVVQLRERDTDKLTITEDALRGPIRLGLRAGYGTGQKPDLIYWGTLTIDAQLADAKIAGTFTWSTTKAAKDHSDTGEVVYECKGTLTGEVATAAELTVAHSLASDQQVVNWRGDGSGCTPAGKVELITDYRQTRLRWLSEDDMAMGWRMFRNALWLGGYSLPLAVDNRIYVAYFRPTVDSERTHDEHLKKHYDVTEDLQDRFSAKEADDMMVCLDAAAGVTLWKRVFIKDGINMAGRAKYGPWLPPCIEDGRWFVEGSGGRVYCLDTTTGEVLWRSPGERPGKGNDMTAALQAGDGVVLTSAGIGLNAKTGEKVWGPSKLLNSAYRGMGTVGRLKWVHDGVSYFVTRDGCVRARDGKECWEVPYPQELLPNPGKPGKHLSVYRSPWPVLKGDILVIPGTSRYNPKDKTHKHTPCPTVCYRISPDRIEKVWQKSWTELLLGYVLRSTLFAPRCLGIGG